MLFTQFVDDDLGCASYLIGCEEAGEAVVVDPAYAIDQYLDEAERRDVRIVRVLETHTHADHVSGHGRLALEHGPRGAGRREPPDRSSAGDRLRERPARRDCGQHHGGRRLRRAASPARRRS